MLRIHFDVIQQKKKKNSNATLSLILKKWRYSAAGALSTHNYVTYAILK